MSDSDEIESMPNTPLPEVDGNGVDVSDSDESDNGLDRQDEEDEEEQEIHIQEPSLKRARPDDISRGTNDNASISLATAIKASRRTTRVNKDDEKSHEPIMNDSSKFRNQFQHDLKQMMYGSGDVRHPLPESLDLMEDMTVEFIKQMTRKAVESANRPDRIRKDDLLFAIQDQPRMHARAHELLRMQKLVKDTLDMKSSKAEEAASISK